MVMSGFNLRLGRNVALQELLSFDAVYCGGRQHRYAGDVKVYVALYPQRPRKL
jgi:hypothetical protein